MVDLSANYLGLKLKTPIIVGACSLSEEIDNVKKLEDVGASAVVLPSLFEEQLIKERQEIFQQVEQNTYAYSEALSYFPELKLFH